MAQQWGEDDEVLDVGGALAVAAPEEPWGQEDENLDLPSVKTTKVEAQAPALPDWGIGDENVDFVPATLKPFDAPEPEQEGSGFFRQAMDVPTNIGLGITTGLKSLTDLLGPENALSKSLAGNEEFYRDLLSAEAKQDQETIASILQEAEGKGVLDQILAGVNAFAVAPVDMVSNALGTMAPVIATGLAGRIAKFGATGIKAIQAATGAGMGVGIAKNQIYESVKSEMLNQGKTEEEAKSIATEAQAYNGKNLDQLLLAAGLGAVDAFTGAEKIIGNALAKTSGRLSAGVIANALKNGITEAIPEAAQAGQERLAANLALQREGVDVSLTEGLFSQAAMEGLAGFTVGGFAGAIEPKTEEEPTEEQKVAAAAETEKVANESKSVAPATATIVEQQAKEIIGASSATIAPELEERRNELQRREQEIKRQAALAVAPEAVRRVEERQGTEQPEVEAPVGVRIEAAAYKAPDGTVYYGPSHLEAMEKAKEAGKIEQAEIDAKQETTSRETPEFGFSTESDGFVNRDQAEVIARQSQQLLVEQPKTGKLHSDEVALDAFVQEEVAPPAPTPVDAIGRVVRGEQTPEDIDLLSKAETPFIEIYKDQPILTEAGIAALPEDQRPRLTPEMRKVQIDIGVGDAAAEAITKGLRIGVDQIPLNVKMPEGWTLDGDVYVPPVKIEIENTKTQYGVNDAGAKAILENQPIAGNGLIKTWESLPSGWIEETYNDVAYAIPPNVVKNRVAAQGELRQLSVLERAALAGRLTKERLISEEDANQYINEASSQGFTQDEIAGAAQEATAKWDERFGSEGNARQVAGDVSAPAVDFAAEEAERAKQPLSDTRLKASELFGLTAREALQYLASRNYGAAKREAAGRPLAIEQLMQRAASILAKIPLRILDADFVKQDRGGARAYRSYDGFIRTPATIRGNPATVSPKTLVHEVGHTLTADAIYKYIGKMGSRNGAGYLRALDKAIADQKIPEPVRKLASLYKQTIKDLGLEKEYFGKGGLASTDATDSQKRALERKARKIVNPKTGKVIGATELYGLANLDEFVAQAWSSTEFQDLLKSIKVQNKPSVYEQFVAIIRDLFGFPSDTMAAAVIDASLQIAQQEAPLISGKTVEARVAENVARGRAVPTPPTPAAVTPTPAPVADIQPIPPLESEPEAEMGVNINSAEIPFTDLILSGDKTIETRPTNSLNAYVGRRVGIVKTGAGKAMVVGYATIGQPVIYRNQQEFRAAETQHRVPAGSTFDLKEGEVKYGYPLTDVVAVEPFEPIGRGNVIRRIKEEPTSPAPMAPEEASVSGQNKEYVELAKDPENNRTALQRIVDAVAKARGYISENLLFHGTTHIFNVFGKDRTNVENDFGKGYYFTNSESDAQINYAGEGPDLTNRIERLAEQLQDNEDMDENTAKEKAREILSGGGQQIMRVYVRLDNPFNVGGPNETFLGYDLPYDETTEEYGEPTGTLVDFINALRPIIETYAEDSPVDADKAVSNIIEQAIDRGGLTASELIRILKQEDSGIMWAADENGDLASSEIIRQAIEDAGFDGIVDSLVNEKFGAAKKVGAAMKGMGPDTVHTIVFNSNQIKSADAITRDDQGNIIPIDERFQPSILDVRYSPEEEVTAGTPEEKTITTLTDEFAAADKVSSAIKTDKPTMSMRSIVENWIGSPEATAQTLKDSILESTNLNENQATAFAEAVAEQLTIQKALTELETEIANQRARAPQAPRAAAAPPEEAEPQFRNYRFPEIIKDDLDPEELKRLNLSYKVLSNDVSLKEASKALRGISIEAAIAEIRDMNNGIKPAVRSMMADITYQKIREFRKQAKQAGRNKEYSDVTDLHVDFYNWISEYRKELGQGVQAFARFQDLGPDGALRHYAKYVDKAMKKLIPKNKKKLQDISNEMNSATEEEFNKTLANKKQSIREKVVIAAKNEAKKVTISEETQKVVQKIVKGEKPTLWENYQQLISDRLLRTLMADPNRKPPAALVVFSNRLTQNLLGFVPEQQRKAQPNSIQAYIEDALNNKEKYEEAFNKTLEDISTKVEELQAKVGGGEAASPALMRAIAAQEFLDKLAPQIKDFPVSAKTIDRFITQKAKQLDISLVQKFGEWYKSSIKQRRKLEEELSDMLMEDVNIPEADAKRLSDGIVADFKVRAEARRKKILERFKAPKDERAAEEVSPLDKFFEFVNMGFINDQGAYEILAERYGLPKYNEKFAKYIYDMAQKIQDMDEGLIKRETTHELMSAIAKERGFSGAEIGTGFIYANMLSSPDTHMVNIVDTMINNFSNAISDVMATGDTSRLVGLIKGFRKGWNEAKNIMKTGLRISMPRFEERAPTVLELNQFGRKGGVNLATFQEINDLTKSLLENPAAKTLNAAKYVGRFLEAQDAVNFAMSVEGQRYADAAAMAKEEGIKGKRAIRKRISEILNDSDKQYQAALQQAKNEGFTGYRQIYRALEINEEKIPQEIKERSFERGLRDVYRNIPTGVAGAMADTFFDFINRKVESPLGRSAIKLTVSPFVITPVNLFNKWLDWSPWGYKRLFFGSGGWLADKYQVQPFERGTPEWRAQLFKASSSVLAMGVVYSLVRAGIIALEGKGPSDEEERKQWLSDGNKPYTIKFKNGPAFSFAYLPWAIPLAWMANVENYEKYNKGKDTGKMEAAIVSMAFATNIVMELPFMAGVADIVDLINPRATTSAIKRFEKFAEGKIGMLFPNALRYIDRLFDPKLYDTQGLGGLFIDQTPFVRTRGGKRLNLFGEPIGEGKQLVERLTSRFVALPKPSVESQLLAKFDVYPYIEGAGKAFTVVDGERVTMDQDEYEKYATGVGQEFKQFLLDNYDLQTEYTEEEKLEIAKEIRNQVEEIRKNWRIEVGSEE